MIFAEKLMQLRKQAGWSQEELAEQMHVTRQSVSKWEGAQSIPDLEKILRLSELFCVSTDYLLKNEVEDIACNRTTNKNKATILRRVSMEEATTFLSVKAMTSKSIALATFLCILSPICLLILGAISEVSEYGLSDHVAGGIGMIILLIIVTIAVGIFISSGRKTATYAYLEKEVFETDNGVTAMVAQQKSQYNKTYTRSNIVGVGLCIMALIPLFVGTIFDNENALLLVFMLSLSCIVAGLGVMFFICSGIMWASFEKLLQENDYSKINKENASTTTAINVAYWLITTALYLGYSLVTHNWGYSWIIWVVAGVIFPVIVMLTNVFTKRK